MQWKEGSARLQSHFQFTRYTCFSSLSLSSLSTVWCRKSEPNPTSAGSKHSNFDSISCVLPALRRNTPKSLSVKYYPNQRPWLVCSKCKLNWGFRPQLGKLSTLHKIASWLKDASTLSVTTSTPVKAAYRKAYRATRFPPTAKRYIHFYDYGWSQMSIFWCW